MERKKAPVAVFAYNRPKHLDDMLSSLAANALASLSEVFVFIDGPKNEAGIEANRQVEKVAQKYAFGCFQSFSVENHKQNSGLAKSIITGVSKVVEQYGKVIVVEDDVVTAPTFLTFMNEALDYYADEARVFSVGGYVVPLEKPNECLKSYITTQRISSIAWGTWKNRWETIDWEVHDYRRFRFDPVKRKRFNAWGTDRASMLDDQMNGRINSWAIRFEFSMFSQDKFNVVPSRAQVQAGGFGEAGTHNKDAGLARRFQTDLSLADTSFSFGEPAICEAIRKEFRTFYHISFGNRVKRFLGNLLYSLRRQ